MMTFNALMQTENIVCNGRVIGESHFYTHTAQLFWQSIAMYLLLFLLCFILLPVDIWRM